ncbi:MAG: hypothetical protein HKO95_14360 [Rhodobacteraceae bacterium]|nr:hypothetical protein [Paracoccaceae bacterium]
MSLSEWKHLEFAQSIAFANWLAWEADYTHRNKGGTFETLPVLTEHKRFRTFLTEYSLARNIPGGGKDEEKEDFIKKRQKLVMCHFRKEAPTHRRATDVDEYACRLASECNKGGHGLPPLPQKGSQKVAISRSLVSKVFAFWNPAAYPPFDRFAKQGLNTPANYKSFNEAFHTKFDVFAVIYNLPEYHKKRISLADQQGFKARVLDVLLMIKGGRWKHHLNPKPGTNK